MARSGGQARTQEDSCIPVEFHLRCSFQRAVILKRRSSGKTRSDKSSRIARRGRASGLARITRLPWLRIPPRPGLLPLNQRSCPPVSPPCLPHSTCSGGQKLSLVLTRNRKFPDGVASLNDLRIAVGRERCGLVWKLQPEPEESPRILQCRLHLLRQALRKTTPASVQFAPLDFEGQRNRAKYAPC